MKPSSFYRNIAKDLMRRADNDRERGLSLAASSNITPADTEEVRERIEYDCFPGSCVCSFDDETP